ncbi:HPr(Ser) kinase/phosphatase [Exiguobacterium sp. UBA6282]|uniref:HPr(Ser) kinase/phosphatase n=1 Tax=Exiguobacterium sp. UBA6282 TaxID=1946498 RepID=UPI0025BA6A89|nr:HPr(Ser) kinase/phosphatase [Exiguobacterium sp. UBA6282]
MQPKVRTAEIVKQFNLHIVTGEEGLHRPILTADLCRPGLVLAGYYAYYPAERLQILGKTELTFFNNLTYEEQRERANVLCTDETPGILITRGFEVPEAIIQAADETNVPLLTTKGHTTSVESQITNFLEAELAPTTAMHGVLVDIYGVGVFIKGASGVGKSETALELVKRGHRLVADDSVEIRQTGDGILVGTAPKLIQHLLEIRGLGIIDVMTLFGAGAVRSHKKISLVCNLEIWDQSKVYDRVGLDQETLQIIDTEIPFLTIPVRPGRNLAVIIEVAAMNYRLKNMGINTAEEFAGRLAQAIEDGNGGL